MNELKNPGYEAPTELVFDTIPSLYEFFRHGGCPGVSYMFVCPENMPKAQNQGWVQIVGVPFFTIGGQPCTIMAKGQPLKDTPAQPGTSKPLVFADEKLFEGVKEPVVVAVDHPTASAPVSVAIPPTKLSHKPTSADVLATK